ncbi:MAG TPA: phage tail sheath subtilisin-like domain-containing protein [Blastocatellia bacterium]|nr:phage tail sheath subtilisin-like domain-containing protein [Blastocatellia bacterium]
MPEYLAPGVYVEEVSFRSKSIEGVSTSTTGFVGPTLKGPIGGTPEILTSLGDFERIFGGLDNLTYGLNFLAHAVRSYFNEGGSRLYVSRVYQADGADPNHGVARSENVVVGADPNDATERARFIARSPGSAGNGVITLRQVAAAATRRGMENAPEGTMVRVGGNPAQPAQITGGIAPFSVPDGGVLRLIVGGNNVDVTFRGTHAEAIGNAILADNVDLDDANTTLSLTIDGIAQTVALPVAATPRDQFIALLNSRIRGGYARLTTGAEAPANRLVIGADRAGRLSSVTVAANAELGFAVDTTVTNGPNVNNNVDDLARITPGDVNSLLTAGNQARASLLPNGRLALSTVATGAGATLAIGNAGGNSVHTQLGLTVTPNGQEAHGVAGANAAYYVKVGNTYVDSNANALALGGLQPAEAPPGGADFLTVTAVAADAFGLAINYDEMGFDRRHPRYIGTILAETPSRRSEDLENLYAIQIGTGVSAYELRAGLFPAGDERAVLMTGGTDGLQPVLGSSTDAGTYEAAISEFERLEDISIVATPGASTYADAQGIQGALITHAEGRRAYRIAVLDTAPGLAISEARNERARIDSTHAALYYPWVIVSNPLVTPGDDSIPKEIALPPSGFVCGIYARNDIERGVFKAPANEVVRSALRFESDINFAQQEVLNPLGVNCLRYFSGRGYRVWGARTATSDPEWKYVNVRRYFNYLEASIDRGTQWAVFEPNGERLWANVRDTVSGFLYNEWVSGALLGTTPQEAFFVRCDRSTMTQNDLDNGRLICLIGVAVIKPAEFVIFRIGQKTADSRN